MIACERGTCAAQARTCAHGHGLLGAPAPEKGEGFVQPRGRGCCPWCGTGPVGLAGRSKPYRPKPAEAE